MFLGMRNPEKVLCLNRIIYSYPQIENRAYLVIVDVIFLFINKVKYKSFNCDFYIFKKNFFIFVLIEYYTCICYIINSITLFLYYRIK